MPLTLIFSNTIITINARQPSKTKGCLMLPRVTKVTGWSPTTPMISSPIIARNKPIPAPIPNFKLFGIELMIQALMGVRETNKKNIPESKTAAKASAGVYPIPPTTPKATNALIPMPGARPIGQVFP